MGSQYKTRFAPSPTGYLHLGHVYAAKMAFEAAKQHGGTCLLRIEDIDHTRSKAAFQTSIEEDLAWLGFKWPKPVRVQSEHMDEYKEVLSTLRTRGLIYRCFKTRSERPPGLYRGQALDAELEAKKLENGQSFAWRLNIERCQDIVPERLQYTETGGAPGTKTVNLDALGDEVLARKDIGTSYHIACCHDDALQNITHVVRGADIADQTPIHRLLQHLMGWPTPIYHHHGLLKNKDGKKLAKRNNDTSISALREQGFTAAQVLDMAAL